MCEPNGFDGVGADQDDLDTSIPLTLLLLGRVSSERRRTILEEVLLLDLPVLGMIEDEQEVLDRGIVALLPAGTARLGSGCSRYSVDDFWCYVLAATVLPEGSPTLRMFCTHRCHAQARRRRRRHGGRSSTPARLCAFSSLPAGRCERLHARRSSGNTGLVW